MQLLYFGWVRSKVGIQSETVELPDDVRDVAGLVEWLKRRGGGYAEALAEADAVRFAVNQELTDLDSAVRPGDEVAVFPPMTGG